MSPKHQPTLRPSSLLITLLISALLIISSCWAADTTPNPTTSLIITQLQTIENSLDAKLENHVIFNVLAQCLADAKILGEKVVAQNQLCAAQGQKLSEQQSQLVTLQSELATLLQMLPIEMEKAAALAEKQKKQINAQLALIELLEKKIRELLKKQPEKQEPIEAMLAILARLKEKLLKQLQDIKPVTDDLLKLQSAITTLRNRVSSLKNQLDYLKGQLSDCHKKAKEAQDALAAKESDCDNAKKQSDNLRKKLNQEKENVELVENLVKNYTRDPSSISVGNTDPAHPGSVDIAIDTQWFQINRTLEGLIQDYTQKQNQANQQYANAKKALDAKCSAERISLQKQIVEKKKSADEIHSQLLDQKEEQPKLEKLLDQYKHNKTTSEGSLGAVTKQCQKHKEESEGDDSLQKEIDAIQMIIDFVEHTGDEKQITNSTETRLVTKFEEIKAKLEALLKNRMQEAAKDYKECVEKRTTLTKQINELTGLIEETETVKQQVEDRVEILEKQWNILKKEIVDLEKILSQALQKCKDLLSQLAEDRKDYASFLKALNVIQGLVVHIATN